MKIRYESGVLRQNTLKAGLSPGVIAPFFSCNKPQIFTRPLTLEFERLGDDGIHRVALPPY
jgi:hypothetical protein